MPIYKQIYNYLHFINISTDEYSLFEWKPKNSYKSFILDLNVVKKKTARDIFFHINKGTMKIVYIRKNSLIYAIGADEKVQYQLLEALLEYIDERFHEMYGVEEILSYGNFSPHVFKQFKEVVEYSLEHFKELKLVRKVDVECRVCDKILPLFVKKSGIENAESYPVPIVYIHEGHAILCFIDKNYDVRGVELVNITG